MKKINAVYLGMKLSDTLHNCTYSVYVHVKIFMGGGSRGLFHTGVTPY
jgi:hypothetical protein